jgi:uncharacterized protein (DUF983 family)
MKNIRNTTKLIHSIFDEKCPKCAEGFVFKRKKSLMQLPIMHVKCECCNYSFEREPGYFLGAMYISYGLSVLIGIAAFLLINFTIPTLPLYIKSLFVIAVILFCGRKSYKISRIIYIHIFPW